MNGKLIEFRQQKVFKVKSFITNQNILLIQPGQKLLTFSVQVYHEMLEDVHVSSVSYGAGRWCPFLAVDVSYSLSAHIQYQSIHYWHIVLVSRYIRDLYWYASMNEQYYSTPKNIHVLLLNFPWVLEGKSQVLLCGYNRPNPILNKKPDNTNMLCE